MIILMDHKTQMQYCFLAVILSYPAKIIYSPPAYNFSLHYTTFLTAEGKQTFHNFINILLCSIVK